MHTPRAMVSISTEERSLGLVNDIFGKPPSSWQDPSVAGTNKRWHRLENHSRLNAYGFDEFGCNPEYVRRLLPLVSLVYHKYFRVETHGINHVPAGRVILVSNHSGQLPFDAMMIVLSLIFERDPPRILRSMVEKWVPTLPVLSTFLTRCGQITGIPSNCRRLLEAEEGILVFPEGIRGISKTFNRRYQLQGFGQGFMRLALETKTPIIPVAVIGAEEQAPSLWDAKPIAKWLKAPAFPITPTFPLLFPLGLIPYPTKYRIHFGKPMRFRGDSNMADAKISEKVDRVRARIQEMIGAGLEQRTSIFW